MSLINRPIRTLGRKLIDWLLGDYLNSYLLQRYLVAGDKSRLTIEPTAVVNNALFNVESGTIHVGAYVFFGHNVSILTGTHDFRRFGLERGLSVPRAGRDIIIEEGVWIASNALVIGPCVIGKHAVIGAGSVVNGDVGSYTVVAGVPARFIKSIAPNDAEPALVSEPENIPQTQSP